MKKIRIGILGVGNMGSAHASYLVEGRIANAELRALCDINPARLDAAKKIVGDDVKFYRDAEDMYKSGEIDGVIIATPHYDHPDLTIKALENNLHVLLEKPAGVFTKNVKIMNEIANKSDKVFSIMFNQRTNPLFQKMKELVESNELGEIKRTNWIITDWYRAQSYYDSGGWRATWAGEGGGVLLNQCPHNLDLWQWICGMPVRVRAFVDYGKYHDIEVDDDVTAYVKYANGASGTFITSTGEAPGTNRFEIMGDRGKLVAEDNKKLTFWRLRTSEREFNRTYKGGFGAPECWKIEIPIVGEETAHPGITEDWVDSIMNGSPLLSPGIEGINGLSLSNAMHLSSWTDDWVDLPIDDDLYYEKLQEKIEASVYDKDAEDKILDTEGTY